MPVRRLPSHATRAGQLCPADHGLAPTPPNGDLGLAEPYTLDRHPVAVYRASLAGPCSRYSMLQRLNIVTRMLGGQRAEVMTFPWHRLTYVQVLTVRSVLGATRAAATVNMTLCAVKRVLEESWHLGYLTSEEQRRACDVWPVKGVRLPPGRALAGEELEALFRSCQQPPAGS